MIDSSVVPHVDMYCSVGTDMAQTDIVWGFLGCDRPVVVWSSFGRISASCLTLSLESLSGSPQIREHKYVLYASDRHRILTMFRPLSSPF